jgi:hypothetical protein
MFLLSTLNRRLRPKLLDLKPGTRIVTNTFDLGDWRPEETATLPRCDTWCTAHLWIVPAKVAGIWKMAQGELTITQEFQTFTGSFKFGNAVGPIKGRLNADQISFTAGATTFTGRVAGNSMRGSAGGDKWSATKAGTK